MTGIVLGALLVTFARTDRAPDRVADEIDTLGEAVAQLQADQARQDRLTASAEISELRLEEPDVATLVIRQREQGERRALAITAAADREAVDPDWGPAMQRQIIERFTAGGPAGATMISATCKTTLCIAEIENRSNDGNIGPPAWVALFGLSRGFVRPREPGQDGPYRSVVFLAREGHSLPTVN